MLYEYDQVLGVGQYASLEEIKRAYRKKAKLLHPDKSPSPEAHQAFIFLTEAYECLTKLKTDYTHASQYKPAYEEWEAGERPSPLY